MSYVECKKKTTTMATMTDLFADDCFEVTIKQHACWCVIVVTVLMRAITRARKLSMRKL